LEQVPDADLPPEVVGGVGVHAGQRPDGRLDVEQAPVFEGREHGGGRESLRHRADLADRVGAPGADAGDERAVLPRLGREDSSRQVLRVGLLVCRDVAADGFPPRWMAHRSFLARSACYSAATPRGASMRSSMPPYTNCLTIRLARKACG